VSGGDVLARTETPMEATTEPTTFTATFRLTHIMPTVPSFRGTSEVVSVTESSAKLAFNVGLCKAMQTAGWHAFVCGTIEVRHLETGKTWIVTVAGGEE
jgi:hypothetical protein